jgi:hypothetical protein
MDRVFSARATDPDFVSDTSHAAGACLPEREVNRALGAKPPPADEPEHTRKQRQACQTQRRNNGRLQTETTRLGNVDCGRIRTGEKDVERHACSYQAVRYKAEQTWGSAI